MAVAELKTAAWEYWRQGCNIVLLKDKKPLHEWQKWIKESQTEQEFNALPWKEANQYAIVCGTKTSNGFYFCAVDFDVKNLPSEVIEKGRQALKQLPVTGIEETPSKGQHNMYYSRAKPETLSLYHNVCALELLGESKLCIMAPSQGYRKLNDNTPTEVEDLEDLLLKALYNAGIKIEEQKAEAWFNRDDLTAKPYKKEAPLCIREMLKGVSEGLRNEVTIRLSSYMVNFRQLEPKKAFRELQDWNRLNDPPITESELRSVFESAVKGRYVFGCEDNILKGFCKKGIECSLKKRKEKPIEKTIYDPETEAQIQQKLRRIFDAENQLDALTPHLDNMIVGEDKTKKAITVLLLSARVSNPEMKQIILLKATEGAGKSRLMKVLTEGYKVKDVGRFSAHALDYTNLEGFEILRLKELGSMDEEKQGISTIKFLSSDDQGYTVEITAKDETSGKFTTEQYKIPPITVLSGTTRLILDAQFERRAWPLGLDETVEQTARISEWKASLELQSNEKLLDLRKVTDYEFSTEVYKRFIEKFEPQNIIIPFPSSLLEILGTKALRVRGDMDKLLNFVKFYAQLNLKRLEKAKEGLYVCSPEVCMEAIDIIIEPLTSMLSKIDKRSREVFEALKEVKDIDDSEGKEKVVRYDLKGAVIDKDVREKIAVKLGKSEKTIRAFFSQLATSEYVSSDDKKPKSFTLLYNVEDIKTKLSGILAKTKSANSLMDEMKKESQEWLKTRLEIFSVRMGGKNPNIGKANNDTDSYCIEKNEPTIGKKISNPVSLPFQTVLAKTSLDNRQIQKLPIPQEENATLKTGEVMFQCQFCKTQDKPMFFSTEHDLKLHVKAFHSGFPDYVS